MCKSDYFHNIAILISGTTANTYGKSAEMYNIWGINIRGAE